MLSTAQDAGRVMPRQVKLLEELDTRKSETNQESDRRASTACVVESVFSQAREGKEMTDILDGPTPRIDAVAAQQFTRGGKPMPEIAQDQIRYGALLERARNLERIAAAAVEALERVAAWHGSKPRSEMDDVLSEILRTTLQRIYASGYRRES